MNLNHLINQATNDQAEKLDRITRLIEDSYEIVVCAHTNPDGDALGSNLGLAAIIRAVWPHKQVTSLLADNDQPVPRIYSFLAGSQNLVRPADYHAMPDLFICVDLPTVERMRDAKEVMVRSERVAVIDHHPTDHPFGDVHLARPSAAAAGVIIAEYALRLGVQLTPAIANCLFCAIVTDTGRFQYQNADSEAFAIAGMLVDVGASPSSVSLNVYQSFRQEYLHLEAAVLGRITTFDRGRIAYSYALLSDFERTGARQDECDGLVDIVRSVDGAEVILFLKEVEDGTVRGNLRAKGTHDISGIAHAMGGGGHRAAAGFTSRKSIDETLDEVLPLLRALIDGFPSDTVSMRAIRV